MVQTKQSFLKSSIRKNGEMLQIWKLGRVFIVFPGWTSCFEPLKADVLTNARSRN